MEEKGFMPEVFRMSSYIKKLWRTKTALILSSFFGVPFVLPSGSRSGFILMDEAYPYSTDKEEKRPERGTEKMEECFNMDKESYFERSIFYDPVFEFIFPVWEFYTIPTIFGWFFRERGRMDRNEREKKNIERYKDYFWRPRLFQNENWKDVFETFEDLRWREKDKEIFENEKEYNKGEEKELNESSKKVISKISKKMLRTFGDGSYETIEVIKRCFDDGTCETTKYTDSSNGKMEKKREIMDNEVVESSASKYTQESAFNSSMNNDV
ncbi:hypothetical protein T552_00947 [Pneumocystis carinii B80]|uniref:Uncharacterized protein n=1 Tax=Pneumocystis carinii (strain B80) TaxID=1408658 RepID=A0A0W4ZN06_PNEC8|nr:hypothetical protein T552_00947 [Pneumocystis carinii B80]KTW29740.1 hypothetical protein T552_00947 [Pneumocystis carinii B80]